MSIVKKQCKQKERERHLLAGLFATFGIAFTLFGIQSLHELLSIKPSIVHTSLLLIVGLGMLLFAVWVIEKKNIGEK